MDVRDLKKIVTIMNENDLVEIEIEEEGRRLRLKKARGERVEVAAVPAPPQALVPVPAAAKPQAAPQAEAPAAQEEGLHTITAPMVGTFYQSPSPEADAYVTAGDPVGPETVVCILEAMKVMNEIKAECTGKIEKVCVKNGEAVEYGQALFLVRSS